MVAGRIEDPARSQSLIQGLWLDGAPLDTLGRAAAELGRASGVAGVSCAPARSERCAAREDAARALADALGDRPLSVGPGRASDAKGFLARVGRPNVFLRLSAGADAPAAALAWASAGQALHLAGLHAPARFDAALEGWLTGLEARAAEGKDLPPALFGVDVGRLERAFDSIAYQRMDSAPTDSIRASYRVLVGRVGWAVAAVCRRKLSTALNGRRFAALALKGAPRLRLLVSASPERLPELAAPETDLAVPYASAIALPAVPTGRALEDAYDDAKRLLDKLANYQIDLDVIAGELEEAP